MNRILQPTSRILVFGLFLSQVGCSVCEVQDLNAQYLQLTKAVDREAWAKRGAQRKSRQVGPPVSAPSHDLLSPLVAP